MPLVTFGIVGLHFGQSKVAITMLCLQQTYKMCLLRKNLGVFVGCYLLQESQTITLSFDPTRASQNPYPKMFHVQLSDVTNLAE